MRVSFYTLGCKVNQNETGALEHLLCQNGYTLAGPDEAADVYTFYRDSFAYKCTAQSDPEIIDLLEKGRGTTDDSERAQIYSDVQDWFYDHHSMVPVGQWSTAYAYNSRIGTCDIPITGSPSLRNISVIG